MNLEFLLLNVLSLLDFYKIGAIVSNASSYREFRDLGMGAPFKRGRVDWTGTKNSKIRPRDATSTSKSESEVT
jgi:hypothetical protein